MDRVRLGRALGYGARHAAKAISHAVEAAAAPAPTGSAALPQPELHRRVAAVPVAAVPLAAVNAQKRQLKRSVLEPIKTFSSVVSLQVAGAFFAVFATTIGGAIWQRRNSFKHLASPDSRSLYPLLLLFALFAYFALSSFVRASRRQRR